MAMKRCPDCGERYSDTYPDCPFCEEEDALHHGAQIHRAGRGGKRSAQKNSPSLISPILIVVILLLAALLIYLLFGGKIAEKFGGQDPVTPPPVTDPVTPVEPPDLGDVIMPGGETDVPPPAAVDLSKLPGTLTVNNPDFTLTAGESFAVKVTSGGAGPYTWESSDEGMASVDADGKVTAISKGKVTITVYDAAAKGICTVYVKGGTAATPPATGTDTRPAASDSPKLSSEDFTLPVGKPDVKLTVSGITTAVTWAVGNPAVATVTDKGVVRAVGKGTTTVTASYDGNVLKCIVRVPH